MVALKYFPIPAIIGLLALSFVAGSCMGSFINCMQIRSREHKSVFGRSSCPRCGHTLGLLELIPVFSFLFLRGKCKNCREKISPRYFFVELVFGLSWVYTAAFFGWQPLTLEYLILFTVLLSEALWDLDIFEVPDFLHIIAAVNFLIFLPTHQDPLHRLVWGAVSGLIYGGGLLLISIVADKVFKKDSIGGADIKLFGVLGLYFGLSQMLFLIILSCIIGLILALIFKSGMQKELPFIPAITLSAMICAVCAEPFINWYLSLFMLD